MMRLLPALLCGLVLAGCNGGDEDDGPTPDFPVDYTTSYVEVRDCRQSGDHDLNMIRVLAGPNALAPYRDRAAPFPVDAVVLKEEYEFGDADCSGAIKQWTVMKRLVSGSAPATLDWTWQQVDAERNVLGVDTPRCIGCHTGCGTMEQGGYEGTCAHE